MIHAVHDISLKLAVGESLALVGESGCGKSQTALAIMGLLDSHGYISGKILFHERDLLKTSPIQFNQIRGSKIAIVFQDPMTSLNPYLKISTQMTEVLIQHQNCDYRRALQLSIDMLDAVRIPDANSRIHHYPQQFSGGMRQRVMIAMALLAKPELLIADEPTTALDVTVQAQIIELLKELQRTFNMALILITHDLGVVAGISDRVAVLYAGRIVELANTGELFNQPQHPYTQGLLQSVPRMNDLTSRRLPAIPGYPPDPAQPVKGCSFLPRCSYHTDNCQASIPILQTMDGSPTHESACPVRCHQRL